MKIEKSYHIDMNKKDLKKLSKSELIKMLLKLEAKQNKPEIIIVDDCKPVPIPTPRTNKPVPTPRTYKPVPTPRKNVKQMIQNYEDNIISPPLEFRDKPIPKPRTIKPIEKPVPKPRTKIEQTNKALKGYTKSYEISIKNDKDPLVQLQNTRKGIESYIKDILTLMKGIKYIETLKVTCEKWSGDEIVSKTAYFNSVAQTIINHTEIADALQLLKQQILNKVAQWISEGSGWLIKSVDNHYLNIVKYQPLKGSSYMILPTELRNSSKGFINIKNKDNNECFRWCHIRHSNPQKKDPQRIKKADKHYIEKLDYSNIEFPVSQKHYNKIEKQNNININVFGYEEKQPFPIYVSKEKFDDHMNLLLITEGENKHCILIKDFNKFMYNQTEHKERKHFCMYCLQCFSSEKGFAWWYTIIYIANRYGKANNKYMKSYDEKAPSKYIMYLDANNLYGSSLSQYLPTGGFRWLTENEINKINLQKYKKNSKKGLILEADLEYPKELHDLHNDYPLGPEKVKVTENMLSDYCKKIQKKYKISIGQVHKLIPTLNNKEKYVLHYRNLQLYLNLGLKITKIHRVLGFNQSPWLKQYIHFNTEKRKNATNSFEKDFFKLMNNSVFGKTIENLRKRVNVKLVTDEKKLLQIAARPTFINSKIINENLVAVHKIKETLTLDRPAYVGMCVLDLSKTLMYDCHYNYIKNKYGNKAKLLFTDTDSLTY